MFVASLLLALSLTLSPSQAQTVSNAAVKVDQNFDHQTTRFPLAGAHTGVTCETCHKGGIFKGVPTACASCHNGTMASGKTLNHPPTSNDCAQCHNSTLWKQVHVDHSKIVNGCFTCHDGKVATGKTQNHIKSVKTCETCHLTTSWHVARFDHATTHEPCQTCHDRLHATGKSFSHVRSTNNCATCHVTISWKLGTFDHTGVVDGCVKCHDGISATGKSPSHLITSDGCQLCHTTFAWAPAKFDHTDPVVDVAVQAHDCVSCHNGTRATGRDQTTHFDVNVSDCAACHTTTSWKPAKFVHADATDLQTCFTCHNGSRSPALGKSANHIQASNNCVACHTAANTNQYTVWTGAAFDHAGITTGCASCHDGKIAKAKTPTHINSSATCESCHTVPVGTGPASFLPGIKPVDHSQVVGTCVSCHDGKQSIPSGNIMGKLQGPLANHLPTSDTCETCHNTSAFVKASKFDHSDTVVAKATCLSCHNGTASITAGPLKSKSQTHIVSGTACETCHSTAAWKPALFDHSGIGAARCDSCHNGTTAMGPLTGPNKKHVAFNAGTDCTTCHASNNFAAWAPVAAFDHTVVSANCVSCHDGNWTSIKALGKLNNALGTHIQSSNTCSDCHKNFTTFKPVVFGAAEHALVSATCADCHNGALKISTGVLKSKTTIANHIPTTANCSDCHTNFVSWVTTFDHSKIGAATCVSCHDGVKAHGKLSGTSGTHIPTSNTCEDCHKSFTAWAPVTFGATEHALVSPTCADCHNGTLAITTGKLTSKSSFANHISTTANCSDCHKSFVTWVTSTFDHSTIGSATCVSCHDGVKAHGKLSNALGTHIPTSNTCNDCHKNFTSFSPVVFAASEHALVSPTCADCHNGSIAISSGKLVSKLNFANHVSTTANCSDCHKSFTTWVTVFDHSNIGAATCFSCHNGTIATGQATLGPHIPASNDCASCHGSTVTWLPVKLPFNHADPMVAKTSCETCHDGLWATGRSQTHILTSVSTCATCHVVANWTTIVPNFHDFVVGTCFSCHDGSHSTATKLITPKGNTHFNTSNLCTNCHVANNTSWKPAKMPFDHTQANGTCVSCHDGNHAPATFRSPTHVKSSTDCAQCHTTTLWVPATFNHNDSVVIATACVTCHNGSVPNAFGKAAAPPTKPHIVSSDACENCHSIPVKITPASTDFLPAHIDHTDPQVAGKPCASCHDTGKPAAIARPATHPVIGVGQDCGDCHKSTSTWVTGAKPDHSTFVNNCFSCHNGTIAIGKNPTHYATTNNCDVCHNTTLFKPAVFDHAEATKVTPCSTCHDGAHAPALGKASFPAHPTTSNSCENCHAGYVTWVTTKFDHTDTVVAAATCVSCHDGAHSPAIPKNLTHIATTNLCVNCHNTTKFSPATMPVDHTQVTGTCLSCHNGARSIKTGPIVGKSGVHMATTNLCESCHTTTKFTPAVMPVDHTQVTGTCVSCHSGGKSISTGPIMGKSALHIVTTNLCEACHTTVKFMPAVLPVDHTQVSGTCYSCHSGTKTISTGKIMGKSAVHMTTTNLCENCHVTTKFTPAVMPVDHTQVTGTCFSCHSGTKSITSGPIMGKSGLHMTTTNLCENCHITSKFTPAVMPVDHTQVTGTCFSCHNGAKTLTSGPILGKNPTHLPTSNLCDACHTTIKFKPATMFNHAGVVPGTCFTCHNNVQATGKPPTHIATNNTCDSCHNTVLWKPVVAFPHSAVIGLTNCVSCHSGAVSISTGLVTPKNQAHIASTNLCSACHVANDPKALWKPVAPAKVDHTQVLGTCFSCHNNTVASGKGPTHMATGNSCDFCHSPGPAPWTPALAFDHTQATGTCFSCHNGTKALASGQLVTPKGPTHMNTTTLCESCHIVAKTFMPAKLPLDHSQVNGTCISCHNGTTKMSTGLVDYKLPTHFITTKGCEVCHSTANWTTLLVYTHTSPAYVLHYFGTTATTCITCHKQNNEKIAYTSPSLFPNCAACHSNKFVPDPHTKYNSPTKVLYTFTELKDCTGACHIYTDQTLSKIATTRTTNTKHRASRNSWN